MKVYMLIENTWDGQIIQDEIVYTTRDKLMTAILKRYPNSVVDNDIVYNISENDHLTLNIITLDVDIDLPLTSYADWADLEDDNE